MLWFSCGSRQAWGTALTEEPFRKLRDLHFTELPRVARTGSERAVVGFIVTDDHDVRVPHQARVADFRAELLGTGIHDHA